MALFDLAKGMAIIMVVYGHGLRGLVDAHIVSTASPLLVSDYFIYTFHMPVFFVVSGWMFNAQAKPAGPFWKSRLATIVYPYFLWSILQVTLQILLAGSGAVNHHFDVGRLLMIWWWPVAPFWFLYALFFCHLLGFYLWRVRAEWLLTAGVVMLWFSTRHSVGELGDVSYGFIYFALGMIARAHSWQHHLPAGWPAVALSVAFLAVAWTCYCAGVPERLAFPAALLGIAATLAWSKSATSLTDNMVISILVRVGRFSMGIYVMHIFFLAGFRTAMTHLFHISQPIVLLLVAVPLSVALPVLVQAVLVSWQLNNWAGLPFSANRAAQPIYAAPPTRSPLG